MNLGVRLAAVVLLVGAAPAASAQGSVRAAPSDPAAAVRTQDAAREGSPLERLVTVALDEVPLVEAIQAIDRQADLRLSYMERILPAGKRVTIDVRGVSARDALAKVLEGTGVVVKQSARGHLSLTRAPEPDRRSDAAAERLLGIVVGRVVDSASGQPIGGASVWIVDSAVSTSIVTIDSGYFVLRDVPAGPRTVQVRHLGYRPARREVLVAESQTVRIDIALEMTASRLQEVVTTATGRQRRIELGNDIVVIDADSIVRSMPVSSVTDLLDGRVPGLVVMRASGTPGDPSRLRLRGTGSAHLTNDPIVFLDGIRVYSAQSDRRSTNLASGYAAPSPLDYLDPNSIETIEVFKGPSAATLYGPDAANGVIVITTKKGDAGPARWSTSLDYGTTYMPGRYPDAYVRWGHLPWDGRPMLCPISNTQCVADSLVTYQALNDPALTVLDRGSVMGATLGVSRGSRDGIAYAVTGSFSEEVGLVRLPGFEVERFRAMHAANPPEWMERPQQLRRWAVTSRVTAPIGRSADFSLTSALTSTAQQRSPLERELKNLMMTYVDRATGTYYRPHPTSSAMLVVDQALTNYYERVTAGATQFINGASVDWRPLSWLTANASAGLDVIQRDDQSLLPRGMVLTSNDSIGAAAAGRGRSVVSTVRVGAITTVPLSWGFRLETAVAADYTSERTSDLVIQGRDLAPGIGSVNGAADIYAVNARDAEEATFGVALRPRLAHRRFWLETALRFDGGNTYGTRAKLTGLPKVSLSWLLSEEPFFRLDHIFNTLRLRAAYGHAGEQPGPADRLRLYNAPTGTWVDGRFVPGISLFELGNTELRPERSTEFEGGFEADLLDDRFWVNYTAYRKVRVDALMRVPLPPSVYGEGASILRNVGVIRNQGFELSVGTQLVRTDLVTWGAQISASHNDNRVLELGRGVEPFGGNRARVAAGYPLSGRWGKPVLGYADANADGILQSNEVLYGDTAVYLGASEPDYLASLSTTASFFRGALAVSANVAYEDGLSQYGPWGDMQNVLRAFNDPTAPLEEQAPLMSALMTDFMSTQTVSTLRLNSLAATYNVPRTVAQRFGTRSLAVSLQGTNLGLRTNYRGKDPNVGFGHDQGTLPEPRSWQVRVSATY